MGKLISLILMLCSFVCEGQIAYSSKTLFKFSEEDGWVRIIEKEWFTVNSNGDTTFWEQIKEDTQQENPGIKKDTVATLIPSSVFRIGRETPVIDTVKITTPLRVVYNQPLITHTVDTISIHHYTKNKLVANKKLKHTKPKTYYKTRWKKSKPKIIYIKQKQQQPPKKAAQKVKIVTYKKKLWCVLSKANTVFVVEANTWKGAMGKVGTLAVQATQFTDYSIIR